MCRKFASAVTVLDYYKDHGSRWAALVYVEFP